MDKIALIIGGTGGIGSAIVSSLSKAGMIVYATYYENREKVEKTKKIENCKILQCDIRKEADVTKVIKYIINNEFIIHHKMGAVIGADIKNIFIQSNGLSDIQLQRTSDNDWRMT